MRRITSRTTLLLAAGISLLALAGCSEEETVRADDPAVTEEPAPDTAEDQAGDAVDQLREGAESMAEGAGELFEQGRQATEEALEDAGPALEKAGEAAKKVGRAVDEIVRQAITDFDTAIDALNERINEAGVNLDAIDDDPETALPPTDSLDADTRAAARAGPAGVGPDYVGVWVAEAADCKRVDQEPLEMFAVVTPTTLRRYESACNFETVPLSDGAATIDASCIAEGTTEERQVTFSMPSEDVLRIGRPDKQQPDAELIRCHLAQ